jgi:exopolysaccharide biosynthesis WecB/TagA/CpsF family protein
MVRVALARRNSGRPCLFFSAINGHVVARCASDQSVRRLFEAADLISADGMSVVFASRIGSSRLPERVATTDLFHDVARVASKYDASFYFLGGTEEVNARAVERVSQLYSWIRIAGRHHGFFRAQDHDEIVAGINAARPDVLWVGLGVPREQDFITRYRERLRSVGVAQSCGGLFDFLAGHNKRAPRWIQKAGFEWAYRVFLEPRRLLWRYMITNPYAAYHLARLHGVAPDGTIEGVDPSQDSDPAPLISSS